MQVFVTGATGFIGSAIVQELLAAGHDVVGLARTDAAVDALTRDGAVAHRGDLSDIDRVAGAARACDGVIHTAFGHDFSKYQEACEADRRVVEAMVAALDGSGKPFVMTSGTMILTPGRPGTESDPADPDSPAGMRAPSETATLAAAERGVRSSVVRLPPSVHGTGDHGFVPALVDVARRTGVSAFVGDGANRWPAVHRSDAVRLYLLALEHATPGTRLHAAAEEGVAMRAIAEAIGEGLDVPVRSIAPEEATTHFDWLARFAQIDNPASSALTRDATGWTPREIGLVADVRDGSYFQLTHA